MEILNKDEVLFFCLFVVVVFCFFSQLCESQAEIEDRPTEEMSSTSID